MLERYAAEELQEKYGEISSAAHEKGTPIIITKEEKEDLVVLDPKRYNQLLKLLQESSKKTSEAAAATAAASAVSQGLLAVEEAVRRREAMTTAAPKGGFAIETDMLTKMYGSFAAVDGVSIHVRYGAIYGLVGKNGAGKTTLMRMLLGLSIPTDGEVMLMERRGNDLSMVLRHTGSIIEAPAFYKDMSVYENLAIRAQMIGLSSAKQKIREVLELVRLQDHVNKKAGSLSEGMRQALGIGAALLGDPELLILDEPINALDPQAIANIREILIQLSAKGVTVLISSHILSELEKIATDYGFLVNGRLVKEISAKEIVEQKIDLEAEFLRLANQ